MLESHFMVIDIKGKLMIFHIWSATLYAYYTTFGTFNRETKEWVGDPTIKYIFDGNKQECKDFINQRKGN